MLGKHYLVWSGENPAKRRQYTICNCLQQGAFKEYIKLIDRYQQVLRQKTQPLRHSELKKRQRDFKSLKFKQSLLDEAPSSELSITLKRYPGKQTLSGRILDEEFSISDLEGPIEGSEAKMRKRQIYGFKGGKGLGLKPEGTHVAFTAGTGILPFLDLVAYLLRVNLEDQMESDRSFYEADTR